MTEHNTSRCGPDNVGSICKWKSLNKSHVLPGVSFRTASTIHRASVASAVYFGAVKGFHGRTTGEKTTAYTESLEVSIFGSPGLNEGLRFIKKLIENPGHNIRVGERDGT